MNNPDSNAIKAVFFDVDGTLLPIGSKAVPPSTLEAIERLKENGILTVVATGRQIGSYSRSPANSIAFDAYIVANGTMLLDKDRKLISGIPIGQEETKQVLNLLDEEGIAYAITTLEGRYINKINETVIETHRQLNTDLPKTGTYKGEDIYMIEAYIHQDLTQLIEKIRKYCTISRWNENGVDIFSKDAGKDVGIKNLIKILNIKPQQTMAFGDAENDIRMIKYAGTGVAMGNADQSVKDTADYVTDAADNNGIENALKHFGLIH